MAQGGYKEELENELKQTDPTSHANRLIAQEIDRLTKGDDGQKKGKPWIPFLDIHSEQPQKITVKVRIPIKEYPRYNFVGKLLGPKGQTLKDMQEQTGCKMAIMGKGSMRDKTKEEECRKEGGKYAHLNEDLHVLLECFTESVDGYYRLSNALNEVKKFLIPQMEDNMYGGDGMGGDMGMNGGGGGGPSMGRGGYMGAPPPDRGAPAGGYHGSGPPAPAGRGGAPPGRGGPSPRGRGVPPPGPGAPSGRGAPSGLGAPPGRGAPRGAPSSRGAPPSRGARTLSSAAPPGYEDYSSQGYGTGGYDQGYDDGYSSSQHAADSSYYDYGHGASSQGGYDSYSGGYGDYGEQYAAPKSAPSQRGAARPAARPHPYSRPTQGGY